MIAAQLLFSTPSSAEWSKSMQSLKTTLEELLIDASSDARYKNPKEYPRIEKSLKRLSELAHGLAKSPSPAQDPDPSIGLLMKIFDQEAEIAAKEYRRGNRDYVRGVIRDIGSHCIACHTRHSSGPRFALAPSEALMKGLKRGERAEFFAAARQFDQAYQEFEAIVADQSLAHDRPFEWERAARQALAIAVRVNKNPDQAGAIVDRIIATHRAPFFFREQATAWKKAIQGWKAEPARTASTIEGLQAEAGRLMTLARSEQKYPADRSGDISYLRASAAIHDLLAKSPKGESAQQAHFLLGLSYEALRDLGLWNLHEVYFVSCIELKPRTPTARDCYRHYEESVHLGYTGSAGYALPAEVESRLESLRALAGEEMGVERRN